jgi:hypothetical protein
MAHIILQEQENRKVKIDIEGDEKVLASIIASAIMNDPHFGVLVLSALAVIAEEKTKFPDINPN